MSQALITSRKYSNLFRVEDTDYLTGNVGDVIDVEIQYEVSIDTISTYGNTFNVSGGDTVTRTVGSWFDEGFAVGQSINLSWITTPSVGAPTTTAYTADIVTITPTVMIVTNVLDFPAATPTFLATGVFPSQTATYTFSGYSVFSSSPIEGIEFEYGLVTNTQTSSGTTSSLIDGSTTAFVNNSVDATVLTPVTLTPQGERSGASILSATIQGRGVVTNIQSFQINLKYLISPLWESITDVQNKSLPSFYKDTECVADSFKIKMLPQAGNPNISVSTSSSEVKLLGNTGFFEENYNGNVNNYSIDSYNLFIGGLPTSGVQTSGQTSFTVVINDTTNTSLSKYKMGFYWMPDDDTLFKNNQYYNHENLLYNGLSDSVALTETGVSANYTGTANSAGAQMDIELSSLTRSGNLVTLKGTFKPNAAFTTFMDGQDSTNKNYVVWASVAEEALPTGISDRVSLIADSGEFTKEVVSLQSWNITNSFLSHPQPATQVGVSFYEGCSEDEILARSIVKLDTSKNETIQNITYLIEGFNSVTQESFTLESNSYDATVFVKDGLGIQQIALDKRRGFLMASGVDKDFVKFERSPIDDSGTVVGYTSLYAFRARWEDWESNGNVPTSFYDNTQLNDNLNNNWSNKDDPANWDLTFAINLTVSSLGEIINTQNRFPFNIKTYEESTVWDGEIEHFNEAKTTSLYQGLNSEGIRQNVILPSEKTFVQADFDLENVVGDVGDISDYFGVIRMEEYRNGGIFKIDMLSTILTNVTTGNILVPLSGTQTTITKISLTKIRLECFIDNTALNRSSSQYKVSARLGCSEINAGKYSSHYSKKYD